MKAVILLLYMCLVFTNDRSYLINLNWWVQMLGLVVNCYVDAKDEGDYQFHRMKASTMDLADFEAAKAEASNAVESDLQHGESEDEEVAPDIDIQAILRGLEIPPLLALAPSKLQRNPMGPREATRVPQLEPYKTSSRHGPLARTSTGPLAAARPRCHRGQIRRCLYQLRRSVYPRWRCWTSSTSAQGPRWTDSATVGGSCRRSHTTSCRETPSSTSPTRTRGTKRS